MKPQYKRKYIPVGGVVEALTPPLGSASVVMNCRHEERGGWVANMGVESWWKFPASFSTWFPMLLLLIKVTENVAENLVR